jgi:SAM-dependent methyltransferase
VSESLGVNPKSSALSTTPPSCFLCGSKESAVVWHITGWELRQLFRALGPDLSESAFGAISPTSVVQRFKCSVCGFEYFDPKLAGTGEFYSELEVNQYYPASRPEFERAWDLFAREGCQALLDVGCGDGSFLDGIKHRGGRSIGLELNPTAADAAAEKGHAIVRKPLEEIEAADLGGPVDFLSFFQVLEHVPRPVETLRQAERLVKPGGLVMVSVPSAEGVRRIAPLDPANMPPHHVSHWRRQDLRALARESRLELAELGRDTLFGSLIRDFVHLQNQLARSLGRRQTLGGDTIATFVSLAYRKLGIRHLRPPWGLSCWAVLRVPVRHGI